MEDTEKQFGKSKETMLAEAKKQLLSAFIHVTILTAICFGVAYASQASYLQY